MSPRHRLPLVGVLVVAAALAAPAAAQAAITKTILVGLPPKYQRQLPNNVSPNDFFRRRVTINVGDQVRWLTYDLHTVTLPARGTAPPPFIKQDGSPYAGFSDAAGAPFWFNGVPRLIINPTVLARTNGAVYDGRHLRNSGLPVPGAPVRPYVLKFTRAGTYRYYCVVHPGMTGVVRVLPKGERVPTAREDIDARRAQVRHAVATAVAQNKVKPAPLTVLAGNDRRSRTAMLRFYPSTLTVKANQAVTFNLASRTESHTVTFGPEPYRQGIQDALFSPPTSTSPAVLNPLAFLSSEPPGTGTTTYTSALHGNGFFNAFLDNDPATPAPPSVQVRFSQPQVYTYECLLHEGMQGRIIVTP